MADFLLKNEGPVQLGLFLGLLAVLGILEATLPRRVNRQPQAARWFANLGLAAINNGVIRLAFPILALATAQLAQDKGWGLWHQIVVPRPVAFVLTLLAMDFLIYLQHLVFHHVPVLWRLHRVHHSDLELDVSSAVRFHFIEIALSMGIKLGAVVALGAPPLAVLVFEIWLRTTSMFHHANLRIPVGFDRILRWFIVTPDMHRVHHSVIVRETNSNFAFNLPWWDRLLGTYRDQPEAGHDAMEIGVAEFRTPRQQRIDQLLLQPIAPTASEPTPTSEEAGS